MNRDQVRALILEVASEVGEIDLSAVAADADLFAIGIDSLEFTTVLVEVEERLGDDIPAEAFDRFAELEQFTLDAVLDALTGPVTTPPGRLPG